MKYVVMDLEWNGAYSKKAHGYFNEIIEIGAVALDETMTVRDTFHCVLKPTVSRKLSELVKSLTHITPEELEEDGFSFFGAMKKLKQWAGADAALLTWSNTDLLVLVENFRFFTGSPTVPFMRYYADIQPYCQRQMGADMSQQMGLSRACEELGISTEEEELHRALDDSLLTVQVFQRLHDADSFKPYLREADKEFYARLLYKTSIISDVNSPLIKRSDLCFDCPDCGGALHRKSKWAFRNRQFCAEFTCHACKKIYTGRVQCRRTFDGVEVRRKIREKLPPPPAAAEEPAASPEAN